MGYWNSWCYQYHSWFYAFLVTLQQFIWALPWDAGILAIIGGIIAIFNAFRIRGVKKDLEDATEAAQARASQYG